MTGTAEAVALRQFDTYNAHDVDGFMATMAPDVELRVLPEREPFLSGHDAVRKYYQENRFVLPDLRAELINSIVLGDTVIYHERLIGLRPEGPVETVAIYQVEDGLIRQVWFVRA